MKPSLLIARTVLLEAVRRREVYAIVLVSVLLIGAVGTTRFFQLEGLGKFFREVALKAMSISTGLTVIVLAARQLPREFENRTVYPLLAKPVGRGAFLAGKLLGAAGAGTFCLALFMVVFVASSYYLHTPVHWALFAQYVWLQVVSLVLLASLAICLSLMMNVDAAITLSTVFYMLGTVLTNAINFFQETAGPAARAVLVVLNYGVPQLGLFDPSEKVVHQEAWPPLSLGTVAAVTAYGAFYAGVYFVVSLVLFRRRPL